MNNGENRKIGKKEMAVLGSIILLSLCASVVVSFFAPGPFKGEKEIVYIKYGSGFKEVSGALSEKNIIRNKVFFDLYAMITGNYRKIRAGEYEFVKGESMYSALDKLIKGKVLKHKIVVPEGSDIFDIAQILDSEKLADRAVFLALVKDRDFLKSIGINYSSAEGFLFPDTYYFVIGEGEKRIIKTMYERFLKMVPLDMTKIYSPGGKNITGYSVLKMASIIEKETRLDSERKLVASVFYNRIKEREAYLKRLESCATVRYALGKKTGALTYSDLKVKSPYNTYIYIGLPPTPICNPGIESIEAAMNPADTSYKYFVVYADGAHTFSETLEEHNRAKIINRKKREVR